MGNQSFEYLKNFKFKLEFIIESLSVGALSVSNQTSNTNHGTHLNHEDNNKKSSRPFKGIELVNNYRLEEQSLIRNVSSNTSNARFNTDFEPIENSPAKVSSALFNWLNYEF